MGGIIYKMCLKPLEMDVRGPDSSGDDPLSAVYFKALSASQTKADRMRNCAKVTKRPRD